MLLENCNPLSSPRETRTPIFDPASFNGENAHGRVGDECSERQNHVRFKNREKADGFWSDREPLGKRADFPRKTIEMIKTCLSPGGF